MSGNIKTVKHGITCKVSLHTEYTKAGTSILKNGKTKIYEVINRYIDGSVQVSSGDIWQVQVNPNQKESTYIAIA